ncbi:MAG: tyrosine-protein phosphatase [Eubacteriales bacterium]|nr:tyrosine-protein phosphatase [Eubacteriales bacterium]
MNRAKRSAVILAAAVLLLACAFALRAAGDRTPPRIEAKIAEINKYGNLILTVGPESLTALGYEPGDMILVEIGGAGLRMPIGTSYSDVDSGEPICCYKTSTTTGTQVVVLALNGGNLAQELGVSDPDAAVTISMAAKQGYADEYELHRLTASRSNDRADYPKLSDAEYANFRAAETRGMGAGTLFRSSSPIDPALNRSAEADAALFEAQVRTVVNMADSEETMRQYADYGLTHYAACDVLALDMGTDFADADFRQKLTEGLRFIASHDGPYLIHCKEGKDRTGFAAAVLECLMGADADEVVRDYMLSYTNFYGIEPGTKAYEKIAAGNIETVLARAFGVSSIRDGNADLRALAEAYLEGCGMSRDEISLLKEKLGRDCGGLD